MAFVGNGAILTSVANQEVIPDKPTDWTFGYEFHKFSFINKQACTVKVNGSEPIFLDVEQGFEFESKRGKVTSFVIVEPNIQYQFIGVY